MWWLVESMWWWVGLFACIQVSLLAVGICLDLLLLGELPVDPDAMAVVYDTYLTLNTYGLLTILVNIVPRLGRCCCRTA